MRIKELNESEPLMRCREVRTSSQKLRSMIRSEKAVLFRIPIVEMTYLFSARLASFRWQDLYLGLFTELGKLHTNVKENAQ